MLLVMDLFTGGFLWLMDARSFGALFLLFLGLSILLFVLGAILSIRKEKQRQQRLWEIFSNLSDCPDTVADEVLYWQQMTEEQSRVYELAYDRILELEQRQKQSLQEQKEYEDYIEAWAHEIKIPLSLMTLVLENRREDMSAPVYEKMNYTNRRMQDYVTQMLYYARLKAVHKDYVMEMVSLEEVCEDVVEEYTEYVDAQSIHWRVQVGKEQVLTDRKGLHFMLEQILNNACKYKDAGKETSYIEITTVVEENRIWLQIKDNGVGAEEAELPFLLDKGFTGKTVMGQAKATGMGLYLVAQMAKDLSLHIDIESKVGESFIIRIGFPVISR